MASKADGRRHLGLAWLACLLPVIAAGGLCWRLAPEAAQSRLVEQPSLALGASIEGQTAGVDRRGPQLAWLTADGVVHRLRVPADEPRLERHPTPCRPSVAAQGPALMSADLTHDGLLDLVVIQRDPTRPSDPADYILPQLADGTFGDGFEARSTARPARSEPTDCFGAGGHFTLTPMVTRGNPRSRTRVVQAGCGRPVAMLDGLPRQVADFDGDGSDDLLTAEGTLDSDQVILRLYLGCERGLKLAGQIQVGQGSLLGGPGDWTACADIDGDGRLEILACEQAPSRVRIWRLVDAPDRPADGQD